VSNQLTEEELASLMPSEFLQHRTPIPTQIVSSDEFYPDPQNERQREVDARMLAPTNSAASRVWIAAGFSRPRPAWPRPLLR
jgi:hypothetical protein